jgi:hypothetical protein
MQTPANRLAVVSKLMQAVGTMNRRVYDYVHRQHFKLVLINSGLQNTRPYLLAGLNLSIDVVDGNLPSKEILDHQHWFCSLYVSKIINLLHQLSVGFLKHQ